MDPRARLDEIYAEILDMRQADQPDGEVVDELRRELEAIMDGAASDRVRSIARGMLGEIDVLSDRAAGKSRKGAYDPEDAIDREAVVEQESSEND